MKRVEVIIVERRIAEVTDYEETVFVQQFISDLVFLFCHENITNFFIDSLHLNVKAIQSLRKFEVKATTLTCRVGYIVSRKDVNRWVSLNEVLFGSLARYQSTGRELMFVLIRSNGYLQVFQVHIFV